MEKANLKRLYYTHTHTLEIMNLIEMENKLVVVKSQGFQGESYRAAGENLVVMEQFYILIVVVFRRSYTSDKIAEMYIQMMHV